MQMRHVAAVLATVGWLLVLNAPAPAAERVALVVGNADYHEAAADLKNPVNDATAMAAALRRLGFEVVSGTNLDEDGFYDQITAFDVAARKAKLALFFYAGHGLQVEGVNYLAPVDLKLRTKQDLRRHAIELSAVMEVMRSETNVVILDACRDNPLAGELARAMGLSRTAATSRGLARPKRKAPQMVIAYATAADSVAEDGEGKHSPYTEGLLEHLETPNLSLLEMFARVADSVVKRTDGNQVPWTSSSLTNVVRLVLEVSPAPVTGAGEDRETVSQRLTAEHLAAERVFWESIKDSTDPADFEAYLESFPGGTYEVLARNRLTQLRRAAAVTPAPARENTAERQEARLELRRADRRLIQLGLAAGGFAPGPADGVFGSGTRQAIKRWQASRGKESTGHLDAEAAASLLAAGRQRQAEDAERQQAEAKRQQAEAKRQQAQREAAKRAEQQAEAARKKLEQVPGTVFRDCDYCPEMVTVAKGWFLMGSPPGQWDADEGPQHKVTIGRTFAVGVHEVTRGEYARFVADTNYAMGNSCYVKNDNTRGGGRKWVERSGRTWRNPGFRQTDRHPAVCISWDDAQAYVAWLSRRTGQHYRLLSESEWEYAARAATRTARFWGESSSGQCRYANGSDASSDFDDNVGCNDGHTRTSPVGRYGQNNFGLHDVLGNVWEWTQDCWHDEYDGAPADGRPWERAGRGNCNLRVSRGGAWATRPSSLRTAFRNRMPPDLRHSAFGFRVARTNP